MRIDAVIGSQYGDEGKGKTVAYISDLLKHEKAIVIRFNGGAQAGHTVEDGLGFRHIYSHFGAASHDNVPTFLSKFFVCNPTVFVREHQELAKKGIRPIVFVSPESLITTPYDVIINQLSEMCRGDGRHGSVGVGFNETLQRSEHVEFKFTVRDLLFEQPYLRRKKLEMIREQWVEKRLAQLPHITENMSEDTEYLFRLLRSFTIIEKFLEDCSFFVRNVFSMLDTSLGNFNHLIFEGAQGLLLDRDHANFPFVTNSKTDLTNVIELMKMNNLIDSVPLNVWYPMRCYTTRHGAGPLSGEMDCLPFRAIVDNTNRSAEFQGSLRFSYLNINEMLEAIKKSNSLAAESGIVMASFFVVNCLDQISADEHVVANMNLPNAYFGKGLEGIAGLLDTLKPHCDMVFASFSPAYKAIRQYVTLLE